MMSSLSSSLMRVGNGLQQAVRAHAHGAETHLHVRENLALQPVHRDHGDREAHEDQHDVDQRPEHVSGGARRFVAEYDEYGRSHASAGLIAIRIQRSTSPRTMSSVPITAITSATSWPRHITSRACRFTNDGGRTRTR